MSISMMKKYRFIALCVVLLWFDGSNAQISRPKEEGTMSLQEVTLGDSIAVKQIELMIDTLTATDARFREGLGGIRLTVLNTQRDSALSEYVLGPDSFSIYQMLKEGIKDKDRLFPMFYTYISGRLVLIYHEPLGDLLDVTYSRKSKKALLKNMSVYLEEPVTVVLRDDQGKKLGKKDRNARLDSYFYLHGGGYSKAVVYYRDGTVEIRKMGSNRDFR